MVANVTISRGRDPGQWWPVENDHMANAGFLAVLRCPECGRRESLRATARGGHHDIDASGRVSPSVVWSVACPRCGAEPGKDCDRRTLGRHPLHAARVDAFKAKRTP